MINLVLYIRRETIATARAQGVDNALAVKIADHLCNEIRNIYGGDRHYVTAPDVRDRNQRIVEAKKNGSSHSEIAHDEGVHPRTVRRIVSEHPEEFGSKEWHL